MVVVNTLFFFSGICLNSLVVLCFWSSVQLRKKICYFMIMLLSCWDLLSIVANHPFAAFIALFHLRAGKLDIKADRIWFCLEITNIFIIFSSMVLLVMTLDRYLAICHPIFHRTSVTKGRLLTLLAFLNIFGAILILSTAFRRGISYEEMVMAVWIVFFPPVFIFNYRLFTISRKSRRGNNLDSSDRQKAFSLKQISNILLASACVALLSIPVSAYIVLTLTSKATATSANAKCVRLWSTTVASMNSTFNCLIFFWKNRLLRTEGIKVIKAIKLC